MNQKINVLQTTIAKKKYNVSIIIWFCLILQNDKYLKMSFLQTLIDNDSLLKILGIFPKVYIVK